MQPDLFTCSDDKITWPVVRDFVTSAIASRLQAESRVVEFKKERSGQAVVRAVAGMANADGGVVFVGVDETDDYPFVGIQRSEVDPIAQQLRALVPGASIEVVPVAIEESGERLVLVVRVDADTSERPVVMEGRVHLRAPGETIGASRSEIRELFRAPEGGADPSQPIAMIDLDRGTFWDDAHRFCVEARVHLVYVLPRHLSSRRSLGSATIDAVAETLDAGPMTDQLLRGPASETSTPMSRWRRSASAALRFGFESQLGDSGGPFQPPSAAAVRLQKSNRMLDIVVCVGIEHQVNSPWPTEPADIRELMLMAATSAAAVGRSAAGSLAAAGPCRPELIEAWLGGEPGLVSLNIPRTWRVDGDAELADSWRFAQRSLVADEPSDLLRCVDDWLTEYFLDRGLSHFENALRAMALPQWFHAHGAVGEGRRFSDESPSDLRER